MRYSPYVTGMPRAAQCAMYTFWKTLVCCALLAPACAVSASKAQREYSAALALQADVDHGAELFLNCISCHGSGGLGRLDGTVPRIAGQHYRVLVRQIVDFRHGKRWDYRMEEVASNQHALVEPQDIADVAAYVAGLEEDTESAVGDGTQLQAAAAVYRSQCQSCHGIRGEGDPARMIPKIGGQHFGYLVRQIHDAVDGRRTPLAETHRRRFRALDYEDINGLCDFIARAGWWIEPPPAPQ
jgi:cytochrome c553